MSVGETTQAPPQDNAIRSLLQRLKDEECRRRPQGEICTQFTGPRLSLSPQTQDSPTQRARDETARRLEEFRRIVRLSTSGDQSPAARLALNALQIMRRGGCQITLKPHNIRNPDRCMRVIRGLGEQDRLLVLMGLYEMLQMAPSTSEGEGGTGSK